MHLVLHVILGVGIYNLSESIGVYLLEKLFLKKD